MALVIGTLNVSVGDVENFEISYADYLDSGELLTGTPTIVEVTTSDLTLANKLVSTASLTILGKTVAIGEAVTFTCSGFLSGVTYTVRITVSTDAGNARTIARDLKLVTAT